MAKVLGPDLFPLLRGLHFDECALHSDVHRLETGAFRREQASGAARDLVGQIEKSGIQISSLGSTTCQSNYMKWHTKLSRGIILNRSMVGLGHSHESLSDVVDPFFSYRDWQPFVAVRATQRGNFVAVLGHSY